jgi:hypothetical protein
MPTERECDPLTGSGCPTGESCLILGDDAGGTYPTCLPAGPTAVGGSCADARGCVRGSICLDPGSGATCLKFCTPLGSTCPTGGTCTDVGDPTYGVCMTG